MLKSTGKAMLLSRHTDLGGSADSGRPLVVMGNGPSLRQVIDDHRDWLMERDRLAVNFAANAPEFSELRPQYYILVDPLFFGPVGDNANLARLHAALGAVDWPMTLIVPAKYRKRLPAAIAGNANIRIAAVNAVGMEGPAWFERWAYGRRLGMPRPRNVLIPSIMAAIWLGYSEIDIVGADHSWMQSIWVDDQNRVVSVQPHFYKDDAAEQKRVDTTYAGYRLQDIVYSFFVAFSSYHRIARFARAKGVRIINRTPGSYIDAFPKLEIRN